MRQPELRLTDDGSLTIYAPSSGEHYHSTHGAIQESQYIFVRHGLDYRASLSPELSNIRVLEVGFGTGLNTLLTLHWAEQAKKLISYTSIELYPLQPELYTQLTYDIDDMPHATKSLQALHKAPWEEVQSVSALSLLKHATSLQSYLELGNSSPPLVTEGEKKQVNSFDVIYFDAFSPEAQPELWQEEVFTSLHRLCAPRAVLTTYCAKGEVRRRLQRAGFVVERLPGPPGKREILRASCLWQ